VEKFFGLIGTGRHTNMTREVSQGL